ncbi:M23 family peptidase [Rhodohalobacter sp. SW132]|uniref:M23 family metallopeptidase n=1 Tax=Rhodohalobacter sp. SW132 TaxID=2293433 RepID=UPI000E23DDAE|nr:M23 family metallopeptidase [Rhodohalobacter sp. SW132]REL33272.1 M23 family peptidase [Rhodohalobacter sp. SW132]
MFSKQKLFHCLLVLLFWSSSAIPGQTQDLSFLSDSVSYLWPTNASPYLSSTFGETRSAHLHSGIDIRTWGREGYEVYATRDGIVHRIGISPNGYGKVIYLKHDDGSFSVYAHLHRFEPELRAYADSVRLQDYRFEIDRVIEGENFRFNRGDIIGYTGSTGVGPPHLHFELRTPDFKPFNPLLTNLSVADNLPPVFNGLAVEVLHPETLHFKEYRRVQPQSNQTGITDFGTIKTSEPIGLAVNVHDRANRTPNVYAVYELMTIADGDTLFHSKADRFGFGESQMMFLDRSYPILAATRRGYQRLFVVNGNRLPLYKSIKNRGVLALDAGIHKIDIIAKDIYGNESRATVNVEFENDISDLNISSVPAYPYHNFRQAGKRSQGHPNSAKPAPSYFITESVTGGPSANGDRRYIFTDRSNPESAGKTLIPGRKSTLPSINNRAWMDIPADALYDTLSVTMTYNTTGDIPAIRFSPNRLPVNRPLDITMILPESHRNLNGLGLYSYDEFRNRYVFIPSRIENGILKATINEFAELRIRQDQIAPWIGTPKISLDVDDGYVVHLPVTDTDSGIDYRRSEITVNGNPGIIEFDRDKKILIYYHPEFKPGTGTHQISATVYDRSGNRNTRLFTISHP